MALNEEAKKVFKQMHETWKEQMDKYDCYLIERALYDKYKLAKQGRLSEAVTFLNSLRGESVMQYSYVGIIDDSPTKAYHAMTDEGLFFFC